MTDHEQVARPNEPEEGPRPASDSPQAAGQASSRETSFGRWLLETALLVVLAFVLAQGIKTFVVQPFVIPTGSMIPTIEEGDRVIAEKLTYRFFGEPEAGDVVVFDDPTGQNPQLIKRVIAVEGQTLDVREGLVYVDEEQLSEPYVHGLPTDAGSGAVTFPMVIPDNEVFLMGDNRPNSGDSRFFGPQPIENVHGRAVWTYWPLDRFGPLD
jgi:signal peptidase I